MMISIMKQSKKILVNTAVLIFWCLVWQVAASTVNKSLLLPIPTPFSTAKALFYMCGTASFWSAVGGSVLRIMLGFFASVILGATGALISNKSKVFKILTSPILSLIRAVPVAALVIVVFLWLKKDTIPSFISFLTVFPIVWANTESGLNAADKGLYEMARVMGLKGKKILKEITLPLLMPYFTSALKAGLGLAFKSGVAAEVICRSAGSLGNLLWNNSSVIDYDGVFAISIVIVALSVLFENAIKLFLKERGQGYDKSK